MATSSTLQPRYAQKSVSRSRQNTATTTTSTAKALSKRQSSQAQMAALLRAPRGKK